MNLINEVDRPGSDIENYVSSLDKALAEKAEKINQLRGRLQKFRILLKDEETLSSKFMNNNDILDIYDLNKDKNYHDLKDDNDFISEEFISQIPGRGRK